MVSKGFLQSEVLGEVCVLEGAVRGEVLGLALLGHSESKSYLQQKLQPRISMALRSKAGGNIGKHFTTRFCRGTFRQEMGSST